MTTTYTFTTQKTQHVVGYQFALLSRYPPLYHPLYLPIVFTPSLQPPLFPLAFEGCHCVQYPTKH